MDHSLPSFRGPAEGRLGHYPWIEANKNVYGSALGENLSETIVVKKFPLGDGRDANHEARDLPA